MWVRAWIVSGYMLMLIDLVLGSCRWLFLVALQSGLFIYAKKDAPRPANVSRISHIFCKIQWQKCRLREHFINFVLSGYVDLPTMFLPVSYSRDAHADPPARGMHVTESTRD